MSRERHPPGNAAGDPPPRSSIRPARADASRGGDSSPSCTAIRPSDENGVEEGQRPPAIGALGSDDAVGDESDVEGGQESG